MKKRILLLAALAGLGAAELDAQSATGAVSITIDKVAYIDVPSPDVAFNTPTSGDFGAGEIAANNTVGISYGANAPHDLQIKIDGLDGKPVEDLQWSLDGGPWSPMSLLANTMVSQPAPSLNSATVSFKMLLDFATDAAGTYTGTITYTVVAN